MDIRDKSISGEGEDKRTLSQKLAEYAELIYQLDILGNDVHIQLDQLEEDLKRDERAIFQIRPNTTDSKNAELYVLDTSRYMEKSGQMARYLNLAKRHDVAVAGLRYIHDIVDMVGSKHSTNYSRVSDGVALLSTYLDPKYHDAHVRIKAYEILKENPDLLQRYEKEMGKLTKEQQKTLKNTRLPLPQESEYEAEKKYESEKKATYSLGTVPASTFLINLKNVINENRYDQLGTNLFGQPSISGNVKKLREAMKDFDQVRNLQELQSIYNNVKKIIEGIKRPSRADELESFYHDEKRDIALVKNKSISDKEKYLTDLMTKVNDKKYDKMGEGLTDSKVPDHISKLRDILAKNTKTEDKFKSVYDVLSKITPERHLDLRELYNKIQSELSQVLPPNENDMLMLKNARSNKEEIFKL